MARLVICCPHFGCAFTGSGVVRKEIYAHFFLFRCEACGGLLASVCSSSRSNLEPADAHIFNLHCHCGWTATVEIENMSISRFQVADAHIFNLHCHCGWTAELAGRLKI